MSINVLYLATHDLIDATIPAMPFEAINDDNNEEIIAMLIDFLTPALDEAVHPLELLILAHQWGLKTIMHAILRVMLAEGDAQELAKLLPLEYYPDLLKNEVARKDMLDIFYRAYPTFDLKDNAKKQDVDECLDLFARYIVSEIGKFPPEQILPPSHLTDALKLMLAAPFSEPLMTLIMRKLKGTELLKGALLLGLLSSHGLARA